MTPVSNQHDSHTPDPPGRMPWWACVPPAKGWLRYVLAVVFVAAAVALRLSLLSHLGTRAVSITLFPAIILAALYGGRGPGLLAGLLSAVAIHFLWTEPIGRFSTGLPGDWLVVVFLLASATAISFLAEAMLTAWSRASAAEAEVRLAKERRQLEEATHKAEQRLAGVLAGMSDGFELVDAEWRVTYLNAAARRMFAAQGLDPDQMIGRHLWDDLFPDLRDTPIYRERQRVMRDRVPGEMVIFYEPWQRRYAVRIFPAEDGGQTVLFQDITERTAADEARARLAAIVESSDDAIVGKTLDGIITNWNRGAERLFGYTASEIVGQSVTVLIPPERHYEEADILGHIRRGEPVEHFGTVRRRKDGTLFDVSLTASPIRDGEGKIIGASKIARDITAGKKAEEKLRRSEALYRTIGESIRFGVWVCDPNGRNIYASQSFLDLVGLTQEQCSSFGWGDVLHPDDAAPTIAAWQECVRTGAQWNREHRFRGVDGQWYHVLARGMPVKDEEGKVVQWAGINLDISDLKAAEKALSVSELRFRTAVSIVSSLIWTNNAEGKMEGLQPGWGSFTGQTVEEYQDYGWAKAVHPEEAQPTIDAWNQAVAEKRMFEFEHRLRRADGEWRLCSIRAAPVFGEGGVIIEWVGVHTDITDQKYSEAVLRQSEERHRALITASSDVIYRMSPDWSEMGPIDGRNLVPSSAASSRTWLEDNIFPEDRPQILAAMQEAIRTKGVFKLEHRVRRVDGTAGWTVSRAVPVCDASGEIVEWFGTASDVTERRRAEEALRESEARKNAILDSALDAIITMDHEGRLVEFNAAAERIFGHARTEVLGQLLAGVIIPERLRERHRQGLSRFLATGEGPILDKQIELPALRADGTEFPAEFAIIAIPGAHPPVFTAFLRDITERRALEETLVARADQLAQADRSKDEFLAMLAHELRNPLAPLRNAAELLKAEDASNDERAQAQRIIDRQIENMSRMIDDLLDVSRITAGKIELRRKPVALEGILTAAASLVRSNCAAHKQDLAISLPKEPVFLNADATRLEQVFGNLLNNACKYGGEGCRISISAERVQNTEPPEVLVIVRDDGAGIDPELLPHIFDLFVQASRTLDRSHGGLGIGLTLVQRLVKLHGGSVEAHSEGHGHGAEFVIHLPILTEAPLPKPLSAAPSAKSSRGLSRRILIVDDNTDAARSLATLQQRRGHETRTAFNGLDAVNAAIEFLPEVVLLDIGLPGMDGFEVARKIRAIPALTGALLVAMSGYGREEDRAEAKLAGFDEYMVKPVDLEILRDWLQNGNRP